MTTQQSFKRRIRSRMEKTGESYTAARAQLLPDPEPEYEPRFSDEVVRRNTGGRGYRELFAALNEWGAAERPHAEIARWLSDEYDIPGWSCQNITVEYERARGLRPVGATRVLVTFTAKGESKTTIAVSHERIADDETAGRLKEMWRERLAELKAELEG